METSPLRQINNLDLKQPELKRRNVVCFHLFCCFQPARRALQQLISMRRTQAPRSCCFVFCVHACVRAYIWDYEYLCVPLRWYGGIIVGSVTSELGDMFLNVLTRNKQSCHVRYERCFTWWCHTTALLLINTTTCCVTCKDESCRPSLCVRLPLKLHFRLSQLITRHQSCKDFSLSAAFLLFFNLREQFRSESLVF